MPKKVATPERQNAKPAGRPPEEKETAGGEPNPLDGPGGGQSGGNGSKATAALEFERPKSDPGERS